jgi:hypothetical protein
MWSAIYLCCLLLAGYALVECLCLSLTRIERFGLAATMGPGIFGICLIFLSMAGRVPTRDEILILGAIFAAVFAMARGFGRRPPPPALPAERTPKWISLLFPLVISYGILAVGADVLVMPTMEWDAFAIWQFKAKVLALAPLYPRPAYFYDVRLSFSHLRYPLLLPMISAGIQVANHSFREGLGKIPCYLFYIGMGACIWGLVRRCRGRTAAIIAAGLVLTLPVIYRFGGSGTAEMALTAFYAVSIIAILRWQQNQRWGDLLLAALASAAMAWTKNEGQALALINGLVILVLTPRPLGRRNLLAVAAFAAIVVVLLLPWLLFIRGLPRTDEDYAARLNLHEMATHLDRLTTIAHAMARQPWVAKNWGIFWYVLAALALFQWRGSMSRAVLTLWVLLGLHVLAYVPPYMVTNWDLAELLPNTIDRFFMHMLPPAALLIGLLWPRPALTVDHGLEE